MKIIAILPLAGVFAENKDIAQDIRKREIIPAIEKGEEVTLDFSGIDLATQSFIHVLISDVLRRFGPDVLDHLFFKSCNETIRKIVGIVVEYMQDGSSPAR